MVKTKIMVYDLYVDPSGFDPQGTINPEKWDMFVDCVYQAYVNIFEVYFDAMHPEIELIVELHKQPIEIHLWDANILEDIHWIIDRYLWGEIERLTDNINFD